jgi:hypothetical protein
MKRYDCIAIGKGSAMSVVEALLNHDPGTRLAVIDKDDRWPYPNPTGLDGVMEGYCPLHHKNMRDAVDALCERKFGPGGPFHPDTAGPWKDSRKVRSAAQVHDGRFRECVALQAQYV